MVKRYRRKNGGEGCGVRVSEGIRDEFAEWKRDESCNDHVFSVEWELRRYYQCIDLIIDSLLIYIKLNIKTFTITFHYRTVLCCDWPFTRGG